MKPPQPRPDVFDYDEPHSIAPDGPTAEEATRRVMDMLHKMVFCPVRGGSRVRGHLPTARGIAARWCVIRQLLGLDSDRSLRECASDLGVSTAYLSRVGIVFARALKLSPPWQREPEARATYAKRQRGVAAGTHQASAEHERRLVRERRRRDVGGEL